MARPALLNNVEHHDLRIITRGAAEFGDNVNQTLLVPTEFEMAQREFPILLRRNQNGERQAVALLGLEKQENLFLGQDGWITRYVPAMLARGPFMIGYQEVGGGEEGRGPMIHVDLDHPRVSREEGEPVFLPQGGNAPYLERVAGVLRLLHEGLTAAPSMYAAFEEAGLLEPVAVEIALNDREKFSVHGYETISPQALAGLRGAALETLHASGRLRAAMLIQASFANLGRLADLKAQKIRAGGG